MHHDVVDLMLPAREGADAKLRRAATSERAMLSGMSSTGTGGTKLALGTGGLIPQVATQQAVTAALRAGYRHIDTAAAYGNEADVGAAIEHSGLPRSEVFVTTKLWNDDQGYEAALRAFDASLKRLRFDYVDLYLLHWPVPGKRLDSWRALERIFGEGRARAIGVSNFLVPHLQELIQRAAVLPAVNQIELHPFLQRRDTTEFCRQQGIVVEAYSPLTHAQRLREPAVMAVAESVGRTAAQVLLRWSLQRGNVVLPKSTKADRIEENFALFDFELDSEAMAKLSALEEDFATCWNPENVD